MLRFCDLFFSPDFVALGCELHRWHCVTVLKDWTYLEGLEYFSSSSDPSFIQLPSGFYIKMRLAASVPFCLVQEGAFSGAPLWHSACCSAWSESWRRRIIKNNCLPSEWNHFTSMILWSWKTESLWMRRKKQVKMPIRWHSLLWLNIMGQNKILFLVFPFYSINLKGER